MAANPFVEVGLFTICLLVLGQPKPKGSAERLSGLSYIVEVVQVLAFAPVPLYLSVGIKMPFLEVFQA